MNLGRWIYDELIDSLEKMETLTWTVEWPAG